MHRFNIPFLSMYSMIQVTTHNRPLNRIKLRNQLSIKTPLRLQKITKPSWFNQVLLLPLNPMPIKPRPTGGLPFQKLLKDGAHLTGLVPSAHLPIPGSTMPNSVGCTPPKEKLMIFGYGIRNLAGSGQPTGYSPTSLTTLLPIGFTS